MFICNARRTTLILLATILINLFMVTDKAQAQDYGWFLLDLPAGWQAEAPADMGGTWILSLSGPQQAVHVRILARHHAPAITRQPPSPLPEHGHACSIAG